MNSIQIRNIGPIRDTGEIQLTRIMLLLGSQGVGKSTFMKILCHCRWIEKQVILNAGKDAYYNKYGRFIRVLCKFHRLADSFFSSESYLKYNGEVVTIEWSGGKNAKITYRYGKSRRSDVSVAKLSFIPAERNLVSVIDRIDRSYRGNPSEDMLFNFVIELSETSSYNQANPLQLSINSDLYYYNVSRQHMIGLRDKGKSISAYHASSGIQSAFPIDLIKNYLVESIGTTKNLTLEDLEEMVREILYEESENVRRKKLKRYQYGSIQLYIEEPEQNLYPNSQKDLLLSLVECMKDCREKETQLSTLVMTTHSPYMLSVLNTQIAIARLHKEIENEEDVIVRENKRTALEKVVGVNYLPIEDYSAYYIDGDGNFSSLIQDEEFPMVSGLELDQVSDWVDDYVSDLYKVVYDDIEQHL